MKKVQIISKDGKKTEVYYLSNHPMNKFVPPQNAEIEEEEMASYFEASEPTPPQDEVSKNYDFAAGKIFEPLPLSYGKLANMLLGKKNPSTLTLDDSLESDKVRREELVVGQFYKIKGLNVVAKLLTPWPKQPNGLYRFSFNGHEFYVALEMVLKHK
tara:strand:+ start:375 stop:845 length:471 start_codon:yes stop_codon:yes gene_type:complete